MPCFVTADLNRYLDEQEKEEIRDREIEYLAKVNAREMVRSDPQSAAFNSLMEFITDSVSFVSDFDEYVHAVVNHCNDNSDDSVKDLKRFLLHMAYKIAHEKIEKERKYEA